MSIPELTDYIAENARLRAALKRAISFIDRELPSHSWEIKSELMEILMVAEES